MAKKEIAKAMDTKRFFEMWWNRRDRMGGNLEDKKMYQPPDNIPAAMQHYLRMWNELNPAEISTHLDLAVSEDCLWVDPQHFHVGRESLLQNVTGFRTKYPTAELALKSNVDGHNQRYRYEWRISVEGNTLIDGFDVVTLNDAGLIERVDGFFGALKRLN